jgi:hypothetical protein
MASDDVILNKLLNKILTLISRLPVNEVLRGKYFSGTYDLLLPSRIMASKFERYTVTSFSALKSSAGYVSKQTNGKIS